MYCKSCGNQINPNAVACLSCGSDPKRGNKHCHGCGVETNADQVICVKCGVSLKNQSFTLDTSSLENFDTSTLLKDKQLIFAVIALIGYFLPWLSAGGFSVSGSGIQRISDMVPGGGLMTFLFLFPLSLVGVIISSFVPQILKFKKLLTMSSILLVCYGLISIFMYMDKYGGFEIGSIGFGLYVSMIGTISSAFYGSKKA